MMRGSTIAALLLLALALGAAPALAKEEANTAQAREHFKTGTRHYNLSEYAAALEEFKEAYKLKEDPVFLYNIAQCHRLLGNHGEAVRFYRAYLRTAAAAPNLADVEELIRSEEAAAALAEAEAQRRQADEQALKRRELEAQIAAANAQQRRYEPWYNDTTGWVLAAVGLAFTGGGGGLIGWAASLRNPSAVNPNASKAAIDDYNRGRTLGFTTGGIIGGLGLGALVTGVVKLAIYDRPPRPAARRLELQPLFAPGGAGLVVEGRF